MMDITQIPLIQQMGPLAYPLLFCSLVTLALLLERMVTFLFLPGGLSDSAVRRMEQAASARQWQTLESETAKLPRLLRDGVGLLFTLAEKEKSLREEAVRLWLRRFARRLQGSLGLLMLMAVVSPLLGLLGTILGMIDAFQALAAHDGPVHPALLADGIQEAMLTTAAGLLIAIPALMGVHLFRLAAQKYMQRLEDAFDCLNLALEGIASSPVSGRNDEAETVVLHPEVAS
jgi:biopolymer transport protein ExbB